MASQLQFDVFANDEASDEFHRIGEEVATLTRRLRALNRQRVDVDVDLDASEALRDVEQLQTLLAGLTGSSIDIDLDLGGSLLELEALDRQIRDLSDARVRIDVEVAGDAGITELTTRLAALTDARVRVDVDVDDAGIAALAGQLAGLADRTLRIDLDVADATAVGDLAAELAALEALSPVRVEVDLDGATAALAAVAALQTALGDLDGTTASADVDIDGLAEALAQIEALRQALDDLDGSSANASASTNILSAALQKFAGAAGTALVGAGALFGGPLLAVGAGNALSLAGALGQAAGVLALFPAVGAAAAATIATLVVGLQGFGDALKNLDDAKAFAESIKELAPAARDTAVAVRDLKPAWDSVQTDVQQALFAGLSGELRDLSGAVLPTVRDGLVDIAGGLNTGAVAIADFLQQGQSVRDLDTIFLNTATTMDLLAPAGANVAAALLDIAQVGSFMLPELAAGFQETTGRFREFIAEARASGELEDFLRGAIENVEQFAAVLGNVGGTVVGVFTAAELAGFDFLGTLVQLTGEVEAFVASTQGQTALVAMFTEARGAVDALLPGLRELATAVAEFIAGFADSGAVTRLAETFSMAAAAVGPLIGQLGQLAGDTLRILATAAGDAVTALGPIVGAVTAVAGALSGLLPIVASGVITWLAFSAAATGLAAIAPRVAAGVGAVVAALVPGVASGIAAAGAVTATTTALTVLGRALPFIGLALLGLSIGYDAITTSATEAAQAVVSGQQTMQDAMAEATAETEKQTAALGRFSEVQRSASTPVDDLTAAYAAQLAAMTPLEQAQERARVALEAWNNAIKEHGPNSQEAADAATELAAATNAVEAAERTAAAATRDANESLRDQIAAAQTALGASIALEDALARVAEAQTAANTAAAEHGAASTEAAEANRQLVSAIDQAAQAAGRKAQADAEARGATDAADIAARAYAQSLLSQAATLQGPARDAVLAYLATLSQVQLDALSAAAAASGFATEVINLPDGKTVTIAVDPETGKIIDVQTLLDNLEDKTVVINGDAVPLEQAVRRVLEAIQTGDATIVVNGNTIPVEEALAQVIGMIEGLEEVTILINGEAAPAQQVLADLLAAIAAGEATVDINGNPVPVQDVLAQLLSQVYTLTLGAALDPTQAQQQLDGWIAQNQGLTVPISMEMDTTEGDIVAAAFRQRVSAPIPVNGDPTPFLASVQVALDAIAALVAAGNSANTAATHTHDVSAALAAIASVVAAGNAANTTAAHTHVVDAALAAIARVVAAGNAANTRAAHTQTDNVAAVIARINSLQGRNTTSTHTIRVVEVGTGTTSPKAAGGAVPAFAGGGVADSVLRMARGGVLPGYAPNQDRIPALLSPGESVLVPELTRMLGARTIMALNRMASGGRRPTVYGSDGAATPTFGLQPTSPSSGPVSTRLRSTTSTARAGGDVHHHYHLQIVNAGGRDVDLIRQFDRLEQLSGGAGG